MGSVRLAEISHGDYYGYRSGDPGLAKQGLSIRAAVETSTKFGLRNQPVCRSHGEPVTDEPEPSPVLLNCLNGFHAQDCGASDLGIVEGRDRRLECYLDPDSRLGNDCEGRVRKTVGVSNPIVRLHVHDVDLTCLDCGVACVFSCQHQDVQFLKQRKPVLIVVGVWTEFVLVVLGGSFEHPRA